uniref:Immunoglobulin C1-set domain-containing protein n=1 Tax=Denticeps clupeoides TaxID=299321 RepID=A0AAY4EMM8_9TELE
MIGFHLVLAEGPKTLTPKFTWLLPAGVPSVSSDSAAVMCVVSGLYARQADMDITRNSRDATEPRGRVSVSVLRDPDGTYTAAGLLHGSVRPTETYKCKVKQDGQTYTSEMQPSLCQHLI